MQDLLGGIDVAHNPKIHNFFHQFTPLVTEDSIIIVNKYFLLKKFVQLFSTFSSSETPQDLTYTLSDIAHRLRFNYSYYCLGPVRTLVYILWKQLQHLD